jgi:NADH-quinone oxidoreductase subunit H
VEAESELVAGFNIEYSGLKFGMFYVAEFLHAFTISLLFSTLFLGGWRGPGAEQIPLLGLVYLVIKTFLVYFVVILFRGSLPRFRIDQMLDLNWKVLTPLALIAVFMTALIDKSLQEVGLVGSGFGVVVVRTAVLLVANILVMWVSGKVLSKATRIERKVVSIERPLATNGDQISA